MASTPSSSARAAITMGTGINLKPEHYEQALVCSAEGLWFEVHTENYFVNGGPRRQYLQRVAEQFPLSFHGVGGSLGSPLSSSAEHLQKVAELVKAFNPQLVSEHAAWSGYQNRYFAELLPLPKTRDALNALCDGVDAYQNAIGRHIAIENPSHYVSLITEMDEPDFLMEVCRRTGCRLLIDVNNLYVSEYNCGQKAEDYLRQIDPTFVEEIHIAGYSEDPGLKNQLLIDSHAAAVSDEVWSLLQFALQRFGYVPVLLERDDNIPSFDALMQERHQAQTMLDQIFTQSDSQCSKKTVIS
ncbi:DUF692 domain-containing protein [Gynuella sunshinyii]|uniref:Uncharacterized protein n=1 Tax=Gynuella sunshinyii YC6258 TaxID=1445510 RepID=A0A0C5VT57_9GAMM|nr:DUF692 domain-containing protein [Gynuella sunshinyii]AJQ93504.1 hypothetical protein YC6258_01456 [Gynuella sunshinyii YC6258]